MSTNINHHEEREPGQNFTGEHGPEKKPAGEAMNTPDNKAAAASPHEDDRQILLQKIETLEKKLEEKEKSEKEYISHLQRLAAEFENHKRRSAKELSQAIETGKEMLMQELVNVLDNFENAMKSVEENQQKGQLQSGSMTDGWKLIYKQFKDLLVNEGIQRIDAIGKAFDPRFHDVLVAEKVENIAKNMVTEEFQPGYMYKKKLLRATKVKVSQ
jgi:molecular chaperone GrpE